MGRPAEKKRKGFLEEEAVSWLLTLQNVLGISLIGGGKSEEKVASASNLTPGERDVISAIERNITKTGFDCKIQWIYLAKRSAMNKVNVGALFGMFSQFNTLHLNGFKADKLTITSAYGTFAESKKRERKQILLDMCRNRTFWEKGYVLNIEELATLFHFPSSSVVAPMTPRLEIKKGVPPMDLPISNN
jgi:hypothetical protein